jgi:hypothetical protein
MAPTSPVMQPTLPSVHSSRKGRTSTNIGPDQSLDTEPILSCLPCLLGENTECCYSSRLVDVQGQQSHASLTKVETAIMGEVADWWQSQYVDEFWAPRNKQQRRVGLWIFSCVTNLMSPDATHCQSDPAASQKLENAVGRTTNRRRYLRDPTPCDCSSTASLLLHPSSRDRLSSTTLPTENPSYADHSSTSTHEV